MGVGRSRPFGMGLDEALGALSGEERRRLEACWRRWRSPGSETLSRRSFREVVLSADVPLPVADQIFSAFVSRSRDGLTFKELIVAMVVLTKSDRSQRHRFLFHLFSDDGEVVVTAKLQERLRAANEPISKALQRAIASTDKLSSSEFPGWLESVKTEVPLAAWLLDSPPRLTNTEPMATFYQSLAGVTHLEEAEIVELEKHWWRLAEPRTRKLDEARLLSLVSPPLPAQLVPGLFAAFDENADGQMDLKELVCGLSASARGPSIERSKFLFKLFDRDADGRLSPDEVAAMADLLLDASLQAPGQPPPSVSSLVREVSAAAASPADGLTLEEFLLWAVDRPLVQGLLNLLHQVAHVVLGLKPQSKQTERDIVKAWYERSLGGGQLVEGQTWYLISAGWWGEWERWNFSLSPPPSPASSHGRIRGDSIVEWNGGHDHVHFNGGARTQVQQPSPSLSSEASLPPTPPVSRAPGKAVQSHPRPNSQHTTSGSEAGSSSPPSSRASPRRRFSAALPRSWSPCPRLHTSPSNTHTLVDSKGASLPGSPPAKPGSLDNSQLLEKERQEWSRLPSLSQEGGLLRRDVEEGRDFVRVTEALWNALVRWYGGGLNSPPLPRSVILGPSKRLELELFPVTVVVLRHVEGGDRRSGATSRAGYTGTTGSAFTAAFSTAAASVSRSLQEAAKDWQVHNSRHPPKRVPQHRLSVSRTSHVSHLSTSLAAALRLSPEASRLWLLPQGFSAGHSSAEDPEKEMLLLEEEELPIMELGMKSGSLVLLEVRNKDLTWPEEMSRLVKSLGSGDGGALRAPANGHQPPGVTGLYNLGNTCYMNSALTLVSNTAPLTLYFQKGIYKVELNRDNVLGMKGNVALAYAELVRELWSGRNKFVAPLKLKATIAKYNERFEDLNQHDCQELMAFLLDGLHEDLNRVTLKPYTELSDSAGRSDAVVAAEAWDNHLRRNQSVVVDLFHGLLKSQVECGKCGGVSVRFDPFTFLSLPLPLDDSLLFSPVVVRLDGSQPTQYGLRVPAEHSVAQLRRKLAAMAELAETELLLLELTHSAAILRFLPLDEKVKRLASVQSVCLLFALQVPQSPSPAQPSSPEVTMNGHLPNQPQSPSSDSPASSGQSPPPAHLRTPSSVSAVSVQSSAESGAGGPSIAGIPPLGPSVGYVVAVHRKFEQQDTYFLAHQRARPVVFGLPLIVPLSADARGEELLGSVWEQVKRLVSPASKQTAGLPNNHARDGDLDPSAPDFPFRLRLVNSSGTRCALCPWFKLCQGCPVGVAGRAEVPEGAWLAVDWDLTAVHLRYQHSQELSWREDESVGTAAEAQRSPVSLASCLRAFTEEEELGDSDPVHCSRCQSHQPAKKRLSIWKLPPVLIVHFKRFQYVGNRWVKSTKMVTFPKTTMDFAPFVPSVSDCGVESEVPGPSEETTPSEDETPVLEALPSLAPPSEEAKSGAVVGEPRSSKDVELLVNDEAPRGPKSPVRKLISSVKGGRGAKGGSESALLDGGGENPAYEGGEGGGPRKASSAAIAPMLRPNEHRLKEEADPEALDYQLYGMAAHYGVLGAGHYVSYAKHGSGPAAQWYLYNDSKTKAVEEDEVDGSFAYLLCFQRTGLDADAYVPSDIAPQPSPSHSDQSSTPSHPSADPQDKCRLM